MFLKFELWSFILDVKPSSIFIFVPYLVIITLDMKPLSIVTFGPYLVIITFLSHVAKG
jgi:hypothetical protein